LELIAISLLVVGGCAVNTSASCHGPQDCTSCTALGSCAFCVETNQCIATDGTCAGDIARRPDQCPGADELPSITQPDAASSAGPRDPRDPSSFFDGRMHGLGDALASSVASASDRLGSS
jgi:hypothetical protein